MLADKCQREERKMGCMGWHVPRIIRRVKGTWCFWFIYVKRGWMKVLYVYLLLKSGRRKRIIKGDVDVLPP